MLKSCVYIQKPGENNKRKVKKSEQKLKNLQRETNLNLNINKGSVNFCKLSDKSVTRKRTS